MGAATVKTSSKDGGALVTSCDENHISPPSSDVFPLFDRHPVTNKSKQKPIPLCFCARL
jgi:hypothetical protein